MSFGYYDHEWVDPDPEPVYDGPCNRCARFEECPCGCGWGYCNKYVGEYFDGADRADECEYAEVESYEW